MNKHIQAKDISDATMLEVVRAVRGKNGADHWSSLWDIQEALSGYPAKVVLAKIRALIKKQLLHGCGCGCRGDFYED